MPDKPAVEVIAGVLREHSRGVRRWSDGFARSGCMCPAEVGVSDYPDHVAAEIDKALGGLRREAANLAAYPADNVAMHDRWVGGWTPTPHGTEAPD